MAVKSNFAAGDTLTASDVNTYLTNGGLVYVTTSTFTTSATVTVSNCFTSTYDSYQVLITTTAFSGNPNFYFQLTTSGTAAATNYYWGANYITSGGGSGVSSASAGTAVGPAYCSSATPLGYQKIMLYGPAIAQATAYDFVDIHNDTGGYVSRTGSGVHSTATAYDGIKFSVSTGTMTGVVTVYGLRKA